MERWLIRLIANNKKKKKKPNLDDCEQIFKSRHRGRGKQTASQFCVGFSHQKSGGAKSRMVHVAPPGAGLFITAT